MGIEQKVKVVDLWEVADDRNRAIIDQSFGRHQGLGLAKENFRAPIVDKDPVLRPLLEQFVRIRQVSTNGLDLNLFQYDTDQSFAVFFLNADSAFVVDRTGQRFQNEKHHYQERGNFMLDHLETHRLVFFVFDSRAREMYAGPISTSENLFVSSKFKCGKSSPPVDAFGYLRQLEFDKIIDPDEIKISYCLTNSEAHLKNILQIFGEKLHRLA